VFFVQSLSVQKKDIGLGFSSCIIHHTGAGFQINSHISFIFFAFSLVVVWYKVTVQSLFIFVQSSLNCSFTACAFLNSLKVLNFLASLIKSLLFFSSLGLDCS